MKESVIYVWHQYQNITKAFFFCREKLSYHKTTQKLTKAFEYFLHIFPQLCHSRFCLIILDEKFRCKSQGTEIEKEQSGITAIYREV